MNFGVYKQLRYRDYKQIYFRAIRGKIDLLINFLSSKSTKKLRPNPKIAPVTKYVILSITFLGYIHGIYISNFFLGFGYKPCLVRDLSYIT